VAPCGSAKLSPNFLKIRSALHTYH